MVDQQQQPQQQQQQPQQLAWPAAQQGVAGIHAATPGNGTVDQQHQQQPQQQQQQPQLLPWPAALQGVDGINAATSGDPWARAAWALVDQMPEPTPAMVQELGNFIESLKFPAFDF